MSLLNEEFFQRAERAVRALDAAPELAAVVQKECDAFFARYPELRRTRMAEAFIASLVIERLSAGETAKPANPENQKVA